MAAALGGSSFAARAIAAGATTSPPRARLNLNENPFGPSPRVAAALSRSLAGLARYTAQEATAALIEQIAHYEQVPSNQVVLGDVLEPLGSQLAQRGGAGSEFLQSVPGFDAFAEAARAFGGKTVSAPLDQELKNDLPALRAKLSARTRALFLVNPHNPSGTVHAAAAFKEYLREQSLRTLVIVDEAYLEFAEDFAARSAVELTRNGLDVLVFRTFSKAYGLAALPFGYAIAPAARALALREAGVGAPRSMNRLTLVAAAAALADQGFIATVRRRVARERALWFSLLDELGVRRSDSVANFVFFDTRRPHADFAAALLAEGIDIGRAFPPLATWARISIGLPDENERARRAVRKIIQAR